MYFFPDTSVYRLCPICELSETHYFVLDFCEKRVLPPICTVFCELQSDCGKYVKLSAEIFFQRLEALFVVNFPPLIIYTYIYDISSRFSCFRLPQLDVNVSGSQCNSRPAESLSISVLLLSLGLTSQFGRCFNSPNKRLTWGEVCVKISVLNCVQSIAIIHCFHRSLLLSRKISCHRSKVPLKPTVLILR